MKFKRLTDWIPITDEATEDDFGFGFLYEGKKYFLRDFVKTHNNPWGNMDTPDFIHAYDSTEIFKPLFIELSEDGEAVQIYQEEEREIYNSESWNFLKENVPVKDEKNENGRYEPALRVDGKVMFLKDIIPSKNDLERMRGICYIPMEGEGLVKIVPYHEGRTYDVYNQRLRERGEREREKTFKGEAR